VKFLFIGSHGFGSMVHRSFRKRKTVIASRTAAILRNEGLEVKILQLDEIRKVLTPYPKYTDDERDIVYAPLLIWQNWLLNVVSMFLSMRREQEEVPGCSAKTYPQFAEVFIRCPLEVCMET